ncbi:zinc transporter 9 [Silurus meridionalis]|nr:zinc transporter 9 [Silurus meridionalis]
MLAEAIHSLADTCYQASSNLVLSFISEGAMLRMTICELRKKAQKSGLSFYEYESGQKKFITPVRAMYQFCLKPRALEVWGSMEALARESNLRKEVERQFQEDLFLNLQSFEAWKDFSEIPTSSGRLRQYGGPCSREESEERGGATVPRRYGFSNKPYIVSLISGVGIFMMGAGLSWYHGSIFTFRRRLLCTLWRCCMCVSVMQSRDPSTNVVLLEDAAAVLGVVIAAGCMGLTSLTGNPYYDSVGSLSVGTLLGVVSAFLYRTY